jgi:hypothetical protein
MADNEGVIKIKGDTSDLDRKLEKSKESMKGLAQHAEKAHGHSKSFGEAWSHANRHMEHALLRGISIAHVVKEAAEAMKEFQDEAAKASKSIGGMAIERDIAAKKLGLTNEQAEAAVGGAGAATAEERNKFFSSLGDAKVGRGKLPITKEQAFKLQSAFNSGLYKEDELKEIMQKGTIDEINVGGRLASLSPTARAEYNTRAAEYEGKERAEAARAPGGFAVRQADAIIEARNAEHPIIGALQSFASKATSPVGGDAIIKTFDRMAQHLEDQTEMMKSETERPTLAPGAE